MQSINRKQFLQGQWRGAGPIRPPWAVSEVRFLETCTSCGDCIRACGEGIIALGRGRYPQIDFAAGYCTFCAQCLQACATGALSEHAQRPFGFSVSVTDRCLAHHRIECRSCGECCETESISFELGVREAAKPAIDDESCTRCGACLSVCPVAAIEINMQKR